MGTLYQTKNINSFTNDKIFSLVQIESICRRQKMMIFVLDRVENIVGKGENAGYKHFLPFPHCFPRPSSLGSLKVEMMW